MSSRPARPSVKERKCNCILGSSPLSFLDWFSISWFFSSFMFALWGGGVGGCVSESESEHTHGCHSAHVGVRGLL